MNYRKFSEVSVGETFYCNGAQYIKHSKRTALNTRIGKVFYFKMDDLCY